MERGKSWVWGQPVLHRDPVSTRKEAMFLWWWWVFSLVHTSRIAVSTRFSLLNQNREVTLSVFHVSIFCPLQNSKKQTNKNKKQQQQKNQASLDLFKGEKNSFKIVICQYLPLVWELLLFLKLKSENDNNNSLEVNPPSPIWV